MAGDLTKRASIGVARFLGVFAAILFLTAWSFDFWQAWVFLLVFSICVVTTSVYFLRTDPEFVESRMKAGPAGEKEKTQKIIQVCAALMYIGLIVVAGLDHRFGWSRVPAWLSIAGDVLVALSFVMVFRVFKENRYASSVIELSSSQRVISTGPYRLVRHPMYASTLILYLFAPIALGSYWALFFLPLLVGVIVWRLLEEEEFLSRNLAGYDDYRRNVLYRLIPLVW